MTETQFRILFSVLQTASAFVGGWLCCRAAAQWGELRKPQAPQAQSTKPPSPFAAMPFAGELWVLTKHKDRLDPWNIKKPTIVRIKDVRGGWVRYRMQRCSDGETQDIPWGEDDVLEEERFTAIYSNLENAK